MITLLRIFTTFESKPENAKARAYFQHCVQQLVKVHSHEENFQSAVIDNYLMCALDGAMLPATDYKVFWDTLFDRMQLSVTESSTDGGDAVFLFVGKVLKLLKQDASLGQDRLTQLAGYALMKLEF